MNLLKKLDWIDPIALASNIPEEEKSWILLYSGMKTASSGKYSFLAFDKQDEVTSNFRELDTKLTATKNIFGNAWFGYLGYGLKNELENLKFDEPSYINSPDLWFARYGTIIVFDHNSKCIEVYGNSLSLWERVNTLSIPNTPLPQREGIKVFSNMTQIQYLEKVSYIKEAIKRGDIYQANLTRKFFGELKNQQPFSIFKKLCKISPAPYSAFIKNKDLHIISSSPERFLYIDKNGNTNTRPIKGSAPRSNDSAIDNNLKAELASSEKNRAENLMIVDLSRNDLARNCETGSVKVDNLFGIESYANVHHMVSSVNGKKKNDASTLDLVKGCFPPGSMTGTPKIKAMEICSELEKLKRGIYAGSIGWFGGDGSADLSVVIRTIIMQDNKFEFQVGGAIVNDSVPEEEFAETITKAKGVAGALGIEIRQLEEI